MKCSIEGCPGEYEPRRIAHTVRHRGKIVVIDHVPAEVCSICGDVLLTPETVRHIESLLGSHVRPDKTAPVYEYS
ncbi:MAG: YgiT-type zinc finger protein [Planctomycetales bacterium]